MSIQELARKILNLIKETEQQIEHIDQDYAPDDLDGRIAQGVVYYAILKANIKGFCQEELQKEDNNAR